MSNKILWTTILSTWLLVGCAQNNFDNVSNETKSNLVVELSKDKKSFEQNTDSISEARVSSFTEFLVKNMDAQYEEELWISE